MPSFAKVLPGAVAGTGMLRCRQTQCIEVLPGRLLWSPEGAKLPGDWESAPHFSLDKINSPDFRGGKYCVPHYPHRANDAAVGPLAVDQTVRFSHELARRLEQDGRLVLEFTAAERLSTAVLLGAFLVLKEGWTLADIRKALPCEARRRFPCSWQDPRKQAGCEPVMSVEDCWEGLELAARTGWLQVGSDELTTSLSSSRYWRCISQYDGSWLAPGKVFVMADPVTVIKDPNPDTYNMLAPATPQIRTVSSGHLSVPDTPMSDGDSDKDFLVRVETESTSDGDPAGQELFESDEDSDSVHSVCKAFASSSSGPQKWPKAADLVSFLRAHDVLGVVRANTGDEPGLRCLGGTYKSTEFQRFGLGHLDLAVKDVKGALNPGRDIGKLLAWTETLGMGITPEEISQTNGAVAFHCKSGFGRSVVLACCWLVYIYDVPGRALLGWSRIARPGAITNPCQEKFLKNLRGRADLLRYAQGLPRPHAVAAEAAGACCTTQ